MRYRRDARPIAAGFIRRNPMASIPKEQWREFCDRLTKDLTGLSAEVEIDSLDLGGQIEARSLPVLGIAYDPKDDLFEIALEGVDHLINRPRELEIVEGGGGVTSLRVIDQDSVQHI